MGKLTPKQRVLREYPTATTRILCWGGIREIRDEFIYIGIGLNTVLGKGTTHFAAWADAARRLKGKP